MGRLSDEFLKLSRDSSDRAMNLKELFHFAGSRSKALVTAVCSLPFIFLVPLPGLSIVFGLIVMLAGYSIAFKKQLWFPKFLLKKKISGGVVSKIFIKGSSILKKIEKVARPRIDFFYRHPFFQRFNGFLVLLCGVFLMLPLPPGTNFPPGVASFLISVGILEDDGLFVVLGYVAFLATLFLFIALPIIGIYEYRNASK